MNEDAFTEIMVAMFTPYHGQYMAYRISLESVDNTALAMTLTAARNAKVEKLAVK